jgi:hypothetical protein
MLESDGLLMCVAYGMTLLITIACAAIAYLLWQAPNFFQNLF